MNKILIILLVFLNGCAGIGLSKKATLIPDVVGLYYETSPTGTERDYKTLKIGAKTEWKFQ
jgi:hypothetical protein